jgi:hypothetical protein
MKLFIFGLVFGMFLQPLLDGLCSLILSFFEMIKSYFAAVISNNNKKMQDTPHNPIGFKGEEE